MEKCEICGSTDFYKEAGYFFCSICQTQSENIREEVVEARIDPTVRLRKTKVRRIKKSRTGEDLGWTSWELYNFVLIGLTNELIELGAPVDIKVTILQLWARYLGKLEIAFTSTKQKLVPKLARRYKKRDAEIIYGKVLQKKAKRNKSGSSVGSALSTSQSEGSSLRELNRSKKLMASAEYDRFIQSQAEEDTLSTLNHSVYSVYSGQSSIEQTPAKERIQFNSSAKKEAKKVKNMAKKVPSHKRTKYKQNHVTTQYHSGPELITPMRLWAILYLALRIHNHPIHLGDMLRYGREGHLSYYKLDHLIPSEVNLTKSDMNFLSRVMDITHKGMRRIIKDMARFLGVTKIICPDFLPLINRYCNELNLPRGISLYAERLIALSPPKMKFDKKTFIPNYEGRALAFIIVILKTLLALDGITEYEISNIADKINNVISNEGISNIKLFSFREWQRYIECRKTVLINTHFPTKLKYSPNVENVNNLYLKFLESIHSKTNREEPQITTSKHLLLRDLVHAMKQCIADINNTDLTLHTHEINNVFAPTLTPHHSYLQQLLEHPLNDFPSILRNDFFSTKIGYMTKPESIYALALQYDVKLDFIDSNLHFIQKIVPYFEQTKMASVKDLKEYIAVHDFMDEETTYKKKEDFINYLHRKIPCQLKIDEKKKRYYDEIYHTNIDKETPPSSSEFIFSDFIFDEIFSNGKLSIPDREDNDSEDDECLEDIFSEEMKPSLFKFCRTYNVSLSNIEIESLYKKSNWKKKQKCIPLRNECGRFIKQNEISLNIDRPNKDTKQTETVQTENFEDMLSDICNLSNTSIFSDFMKTEVEYNDQFSSCDEIFEAENDKFFYTSHKKTYDILKLFRPFKNYWMYHCNFSRVKSKNFELFEKMLPRSFRWLLNECASIIEMSPEDLYAEVCLIEAYYVNIIKESEISTLNENVESHNNQTYINAILHKW